ncbi:flagellar motor protein MotB [Paracoccus sp. SCSIO 75233]|uniref:flagellar motor protein MotB n=1 Tax=Paracoccus sp. SCSIO 75233 TaxID=3017782 RepID=UPI0022F1266F|nr:flagellar motor protein MotB [Paracoccus sp. SCSIO 75233]WBU52945.1 OmpA family protein [Paracoccus sp. SCSIO 75233]
MPQDKPIILKRVVISDEGGHHGGAWKVAYADFVTAMMAFFLLMWLLNATSEKQREGLAEYFSPTLVRVVSGSGGDGGAAGDGQGNPAEVDQSADGLENLRDRVEADLAGIGAESMQMKNLMRHVVTRVTDEGVVLELRDLSDAPLFFADSTEPAPVLRPLLRVISRVIARAGNGIAIAGHVRSYPAALAGSPEWALSTGRADVVRQLLQEGGFPPRHIQRVTGYADRRNNADNADSAENDLLEVILLK